MSVHEWKGEWALVEESLRRLRIDLAQGRDPRSAFQALNVAERSIFLFPLVPVLEELSELAATEADIVLQAPEELEAPRQWESLIHEFLLESLRNWKSHGRESRAERRFLNKPDVYRLRISARLVQGRLVIEVDDDGPGIHPAQVLQKAAELGALTASERAAIEEQLRQGNADSVYELLFRDGLSTRPAADQDAGRGMGLSRLLSEASRLGARLLARKSDSLGGFKMVLELPCRVLGACTTSVDSAPGVQGSLCVLRSGSSDPGAPGSFRVFSLLPPESAAWTRDYFGGRKVSWVCVEPGPAGGGFTATGLLDEA